MFATFNTKFSTENLIIIETANLLCELERISFIGLFGHMVDGTRYKKTLAFLFCYDNGLISKYSDELYEKKITMVTGEQKK